MGMTTKTTAKPASIAIKHGFTNLLYSSEEEMKIKTTTSYRIAEHPANLSNQPWREAVGIEEIEHPRPLSVPSLICWFSRGTNELAEQTVRLLNGERT